MYVLAGGGKGRYVFDRNRQDPEAVAFFCQYIPWLRTALAAIRDVRGNIELLACLLGELDERPVINLTLSAEWLELRGVIVAALEPHAEARESVLRALESADNGSA